MWDPDRWRDEGCGSGGLALSTKKCFYKLEIFKISYQSAQNNQQSGIKMTYTEERRGKSKYLIYIYIFFLIVL